MGYKYKRKTLGSIDCRPKSYSGLFPRPHSSCNHNCLYFIFCEIETKHISLGERIKEVRLILQRPYHLMSFLSEELGYILVLEGMDVKTEPRLSFRGKTMVETVESAERYIKKERNVGAIKKEEPEDDYTPSEEEMAMTED